MQLTEAQAQQLLAVRRALLNEVGALIAEWDRQWAELQVGAPIDACASMRGVYFILRLCG